MSAQVALDPIRLGDVPVFGTYFGKVLSFGTISHSYPAADLQGGDMTGSASPGDAEAETWQQAAEAAAAAPVAANPPMQESSPAFTHEPPASVQALQVQQQQRYATQPSARMHTGHDIASIAGVPTVAGGRSVPSVAMMLTARQVAELIAAYTARSAAFSPFQCQVAAWLIEQQHLHGTAVAGGQAGLQQQQQQQQQQEQQHSQVGPAADFTDEEAAVTRQCPAYAAVLAEVAALVAAGLPVPPELDWQAFVALFSNPAMLATHQEPLEIQEGNQQPPTYQQKLSGKRERTEIRGGDAGAGTSAPAAAWKRSRGALRPTGMKQQGRRPYPDPQQRRQQQQEVHHASKGKGLMTSNWPQQRWRGAGNAGGAECSAAAGSRAAERQHRFHSELCLAKKKKIVSGLWQP